MRPCFAILAGLALMAPLQPGPADSLRAASPARIDDVLLTIHARNLLDNDAELKSLNIGVQVVDRVAILWGPIPKVDLGLRAESRLRGMIELRDVRNELDVAP